MKLIDVDNFLKRYSDQLLGDTIDAIDLRLALLEEPEVNAIPIEWLNKWLKVCAEEEAQVITVMAYAWNLDEGQKRWEKENDKTH